MALVFGSLYFVVVGERYFTLIRLRLIWIARMLLRPILPYITIRATPSGFPLGSLLGM